MSHQPAVDPPHEAPPRARLRPAEADGASDLELVRLAQAKPQGWARAVLVERHLPLVRAIAHRYAGRGEQLEDLVQTGSLGLLKAIDRFDPSRGVELKTYAVSMIAGEIKRHFRDATWPIHVTRSVQELNVRLVRLLDELAPELGRSPTIAELAAAADADEEAVLEALEAGQARRPRSLSAPDGEGEEGDLPALVDTVGSDDPGYARCEAREAIRRGIGALDARERTILRLRFFDGLTQSQIATRIGVSQMHVSRLLRSSLEQIAAEIGAEARR